MEPGTFTEEEITGIKDELKSLGIRKAALAQKMDRLRPIRDIYEELRQWEEKLLETTAMLSRAKEGTAQYKGYIEQRIRILLYQENLRRKLPNDAAESEIRRLYTEAEEEYWSVDRQMDQHRRSLIDDVKAKRKNGIK